MIDTKGVSGGGESARPPFGAGLGGNPPAPVNFHSHQLSHWVDTYGGEGNCPPPLPLPNLHSIAVDCDLRREGTG